MIGLVLVISYVYAMFQGGFVSWFLLLSVVATIMITVLMALSTLKGFKVERHLSGQRLKSGDTLGVEVIVKKHRLHPFFYVSVEDQVPEAGQVQFHKALFFFSFAKELRFQYKIKNVKRGEHQWQETELVFGDLLGIFERRVRVHHDSSFLVYPTYAELDQLPETMGTHVKEGMKSHMGGEEERSLAGVRGYVPGDRMTSIDWKQSARTSKLMTKEFETYQHEGVVILFDPYLKRGSEAVFERSITLAASLTATAVKINPRVTFSIRTSNWKSYDVSRHQMHQVLHLLAKVKRSDVALPSIHRKYREWKGKTVYVVCAELDEDMISAFEVMKKQQVTVQVCLVGEGHYDFGSLQELRRKGIFPQEIRMSHI